MNATLRRTSCSILAAATLAGAMATLAPAARAAAPVTAPTVRAVTSSDRITYSGVGSLRIDVTTQAQLRRAALVVPGQCVPGWDSATSLRRAGVWISVPTGQRLADIDVTTPTVRTFSGVRVGMTIAQARRIYGSQFHVKMLTTDGLGSIPAGQVTNGKREVLFLTRDGKVNPTSVITDIHLRDVAGYLPAWDAC